MGEMERRILAGLLAVSMCVMYLPADMRQVRAEESVIETIEETADKTETIELLSDTRVSEDDGINDIKEQVEVQEGTEYEETAEFLHQYVFEPEETGEYRLNLQYNGSGSIWFSHFEDEGGNIVERKLYLNRQAYVIKLDKGKKYQLYFGRDIDALDSDSAFTWRIQKISDFPLTPEKSETFSIGDPISYTFSPEQDALYRLTFEKPVDFQIYAENTGISEEWMESYYSDGRQYIYRLKAGETYQCYLNGAKEYKKEYEGAGCQILLEKMTPKSIEADTIYTKEENESVYYIFRAKTAGNYLVKGEVWNKDFSHRTYRWNQNEIIALETNEEIAILTDPKERNPCISLVRDEGGIEYATQPDGTIEVVGYHGEKREIEIPDMVGGKQVTVIGVSAFHNSDVTLIKLPLTLREIRYGAFWGSKLTEIVIPDSVTSIGGSAFEDCVSLKRVVIGSGLEAIRSCMFRDCHSLEELVMPENGSLTEIQYAALADCRSLSEISFPDTIESCGWTIMTDMDDEYTLWYRNHPDGEVYIGKVLYEYKGTAPEGTKIYVKPGTVSVADWAFDRQTGVTEVVLPYGLKRIGNDAFCCGRGIKSIVIPATVTEIGSHAVGYEKVYTETQWGGYYASVKLDDFIIYGEKGTAAETYAIENGFEFIEKMTYLRGDVDLSGKVDISDLRLMLRSVCGKVALTGDQITAGDIAGQTNADEPDGKITIADLRKLLRYICGKIEAL